MPIVTIIAPALADRRSLAQDVADAVADALALRAGDVIALLQDAGATIASGGVDAGTWIVVTIAGRSRGAAATMAARTAVEAAVRDWALARDVALQGVWVAWTTPAP